MFTELYDELADEDDDVDKLAMRFVSSATIDAQHHEVENAAFARIKNDRPAESREVLAIVAGVIAARRRLC